MAGEFGEQPHFAGAAAAAASLAMLGALMLCLWRRSKEKKLQQALNFTQASVRKRRTLAEEEAELERGGTNRNSTIEEEVLATSSERKPHHWSDDVEKAGPDVTDVVAFGQSDDEKSSTLFTNPLYELERRNRNLSDPSRPDARTAASRPLSTTEDQMALEDHGAGAGGAPAAPAWKAMVRTPRAAAHPAQSAAPPPEPIDAPIPAGVVRRTSEALLSATPAPAKWEVVEIRRGTVQAALSLFKPEEPPSLPMSRKSTRRGSLGAVGLVFPEYPGMHSRRGTVLVRDWATPQPSYSPVEFNAKDLQKREDADPPAVRRFIDSVRFNAVDQFGAGFVDRTSLTGPYALHLGLPRNPSGRTGVVGRGQLARWGPNHMVHLIITRWASTPEGDSAFHDGRRVVEFVAHRRGGALELPKFALQAGVPAPPWVLKWFSAGALQTESAENFTIVLMAQDAFQNARLLDFGLPDDPRCTDQAWVEVRHLWVHDATGFCFNYFPLGGDLAWTILSADLDVPRDDQKALLKVSADLDAFWTNKVLSEIISLPEDMMSPNLVYAPLQPGTINYDAAVASSGKLAEDITLDMSAFLPISVTPEPFPQFSFNTFDYNFNDLAAFQGPTQIQMEPFDYPMPALSRKNSGRSERSVQFQLPPSDISRRSSDRSQPSVQISKTPADEIRKKGRRGSGGQQSLGGLQSRSGSAGHQQLDEEWQKPNAEEAKQAKRVVEEKRKRELEEEKRKQQEEAKRKLEEEKAEKRRLEDEKRKQLAEEKQRLEEEKRRQEEEKRRLEEEKRKQLAEEKQRQEEEKRRLEEEKLRKLEEEKQRKLEEERKQQLLEEQKRKDEEEKRRKLEEEEKQRVEEEKRKQQLVEEKQRQQYLETLNQEQKAQEEIKHKQLEEQRKIEEEEQRKRQEEEKRKLELLAEEKRKEEEKRKAEAEKQKLEEEQKRKDEEEKRKAEAEKLRVEEEAKRKAEDEKRMAEERAKAVAAEPPSSPLSPEPEAERRESGLLMLNPRLSVVSLDRSPAPQEQRLPTVTDEPAAAAVAAPAPAPAAPVPAAVPPPPAVADKDSKAKKSVKAKDDKKAKKKSEKGKKDKEKDKGKDKKAEEPEVTEPAVTRAKEGFVGVYEVQFLGSVPTTNTAGGGAISACVKAVLASPAVDQPSIQLVISAEGMEMEEGAPRNEETGSILSENQAKLLRIIPIRQISYASDDPSNPGILGFISLDAKTGSQLCFVFRCRRPAYVLSSAVSRAFQLAAQLRTDPFAISREGALTPEAITPLFKPLQANRANYKVKSIIGQGQYGKVYLAETADGSEYAIKLMRAEASVQYEADFITEATILLNFKHPKLLELIAVCLEKKPWLLVTDFMIYKDLSVVLRQCHKKKVYLRTHELLTFAVQVADGLSYLAKNRYLHRDIAARNILLDADNEVKIADFGLTRKLPDGEDQWRLDKLGRLPVKYMAIETLTAKVFSLASDVWAFGVFLWELLSYAENPWEKEGIAPEGMKKAVAGGARLSPPEIYHVDSFGDDPEGFQRTEEVFGEMFQIASTCWAREPAERPDIFKLFSQLLALFQAESKRLPPMRDVGEELFETLEANKGPQRRVSGQRGGSMIRTAPLKPS